MKRFMIVLGLLCLTQGFARADFITLTKSNGTFLAGTGIPTGYFTIDNGANGSSTNIQVRSRDTGVPLSQVGNQYYVQTGLAGNNVSPWWQFDFQFDIGGLPLPASSVILRLRVDFDPTAAISFTDVLLPADAWGTAFRTNPANGTWSDNTTPWAVSESWNMGFAFWQGLGAPAFDPNATGQYAIQFGAYANEQTIAETTVFANVMAVPVPAGLVQAGIGMSLVGAIWLAQYRRRQQRSQVIAA